MSILKNLEDSAVWVQLIFVGASSCTYAYVQGEMSHKVLLSASQVLNFDSPRGGISLETEKRRTGTTSRLLVTRAGTADSGNYTCLPSRGEAVSADVHIITGEFYSTPLY